MNFIIQTRLLINKNYVIFCKIVLLVLFDGLRFSNKSNNINYSKVKIVLFLLLLIFTNFKWKKNRPL